MSEHERKGGEIVLERVPTRQAAKEPPKFAVVLLNDDFTPMDFVVLLLINLFRKSQDEAEAIMLDVHNKGKGIAGVYTKDIAETRVHQANSIAQENEHPFRCQMEPE
jgi:ATP-dependent Clp protease adaptor protein ClpS